MKILVKAKSPEYADVAKAMTKIMNQPDVIAEVERRAWKNIRKMLKRS